MRFGERALILLASQDLTTDKDSIALIESFLKAGKPVASVCHGASCSLSSTPRKGTGLTLAARPQARPSSST